MTLFSALLASDPASPRLTVYSEDSGARMDFSALTLDNWASKIANFLEEELDLSAGDAIGIDLPVMWQAAVIALGAAQAGVDYSFGPGEGAPVVFATVERAAAHTDSPARPDVVVVSEDPFGRGVVEAGGQLPEGTLDFGPTVRFYGDQYFGQPRSLEELVESTGPAERLLSCGWADGAEFAAQVLAPLAAGGSAVVVAGVVSPERLDDIAAKEKVTARY